MKYHRITLLISLLAGLTILFSRCFSPASAGDPRGEGYAGSNACFSCHRDISASYTHNNHYKTSSEPSAGPLKKLLTSSKDRFYFADSSYIRMEEDNYLLFQTCMINGQKTSSEKFDIAFGSGEKAQTYGYWKDSRLYQLPLTWFAALNTWANSPGFSARRANFSRVITSRCFECHASYIKRDLVQSGPLSVSENLDKNSIIYGIDCERCHGPALQHVKFHEDNPTVRTARYMTPIRSLSRQQQLDVCAVCHSGNDQATRQTMFAFAPGDTLSHYYYPDFMAASGEPDVHGKQVQLLQASECFRHSSMTCTTCHTPHGPEENKQTDFIAACMQCHQHSAHSINVEMANEQKKRDFNLVGPTCIDCHMPLQISQTIHSDNGAGSKNIPYLLRTHKIAIYK